MKKLTKKGVSNIDKDIIVFAFFLFLSFVFWYLNSLGKEIETNIRYPVRYVNLPKEKVLEEDLPARLELYLKGPGYSILKLRLPGNRAPVILDISSISYRRAEGSSALRYYIMTSSLIPKLSGQLVKISGPGHIVDTVTGFRTKFKIYTSVNRVIKKL